MLRQLAVRNANVLNVRMFSSSVARFNKGPIDSAKDAMKSVDRAVSDQAVKGIEKGQEAARSVKESTGMGDGTATSQAQGKVSEMSGEAKGKANELAGEAKGKAQEMKGEAKAKM